MTRSYDKGVRIASNSWGLILPLGYISLHALTTTLKRAMLALLA